MTALTFRKASRDDLQTIVDMLADDHLGTTRESPDDLTPYIPAFEAINRDPNQLLVVCERDGAIVGTMQLTITPGLSRKGASRMTIEGVRVHQEARGSGLGGDMVRWAISEAREQGCRMVQLTTDKSRTDAHRFYERLGFEPTHVGYKLNL